MHRTGLLLTVLLGLNAYAIAPLAASTASLDPLPLAPVVTFSYSAAPETQEREWFYIHGTVNVRTEPRPDAAIIRTLQRGDSAQLGPRDANGWARVYSPGSGEGYVYRASEQVQRQAPAARSLASASSGSVRGARRSSGGSRRSSGSRVYHTGPRGGCYYINGSGNKEYVERWRCR